MKQWICRNLIRDRLQPYMTLNASDVHVSINMIDAFSEIG